MYRTDLQFLVFEASHSLTRTSYQPDIFPSHPHTSSSPSSASCSRFLSYHRCSLPFSAQVQLSFWLVVGVYVAGWQVTSPAWESGASRSSGWVHSMGKGCSDPAGCVVMGKEPGFLTAGRKSCHLLVCGD